MSDPIERLNAALEGRYAIERELGEGGMPRSVRKSSPTLCHARILVVYFDARRR